MTPTRWQEIERVYHAALEHPVAERAEFLAETCKNDPGLKREVESLLAHESSLTALMDRPAAMLLGDSLRTEPVVGAQLGPYRIEEPIGAGGMGRVYRGRDTRLHRTVAIKVLPPDKVADPERRRRFMQEARAASALNHPNIVTLYDIANDGGIDYLVMEYVPGKSLDKHIAPQGMPLGDAIHYATQIARALAAAHAVGIVHRDIKPANVMVTSEGQVKILDFGLAKLVESSEGLGGETQTKVLTEAGMVMGTVAYMSPEQAGGRLIDQRTDIFSLGVVLYEMLMGGRPFGGKSHGETMNAIINEPTPLTGGQAPELEEILAKALEKEPKERYQHAGDFALDLHRFERAWKTKSLPSLRRPVPALQPALQPRTWIAIAVLVLLFTTGAAWLAIHSVDSWANPLENAQFSRLTDFDGSEVDAALSPDGKFVTFLSDQSGLFDAFIGQLGVGNFVNVTRGRFEELFHEQTRSVGFSGDGGELWLRVAVPDPVIPRPSGQSRGVWMIPAMGGPPRRFLERAIYAAWSPDTTKVVYGEPLPGDPIFVADSHGMSPRQIFVGKPGEHAHYMTWSLDGREIYFVRGYRSTEMDVWKVPAEGGQAERITHHNSTVAYPVVLEDQTLLYIATAEDGAGSWLYAMDLKSHITHRANLGVEHFVSIAGSSGPNGAMSRLVATVGNPRGTLWTVPILDQVAKEVDAKRLQLPAVRAVSPRYGPDYLLYLSSKGGGDGLWKFKDGATTELWKPTDEVLTAPAAISPDGTRICFTVKKGERRHLYIMTSDGTGIRPLAETLDVRDSASWSPDGKSVLVSVDEGEGGRIFRIPVDGGEPEKIVDEHSYNPVWSPDGRLILYYFSQQGATYSLKAITPEKQPYELPDIAVRGEGGRFRFLPDGRSFVALLGPFRSQNFYLVNVDTGVRRQLTNFKPGYAMRDFDISPDGRQIVFDRVQENSDIVLIDLPAKR